MYYFVTCEIHHNHKANEHTIVDVYTNKNDAFKSVCENNNASKNGECAGSYSVVSGIKNLWYEFRSTEIVKSQLAKFGIKYRG